MTRQRRIYLDQAATSWPKLPAAVEAAAAFVRECGATAGRGAYGSAQVADRWIADARHSLARLIHAERSDSIALCSSGTHALNAALYGLLRPGEHVISTAIEHNSVLRPLHQLQTSIGIELSIAPCDCHGHVDPSSIEKLARRGSSTLVVGHASNVTGAIQDLAACGEIAQRLGLRFIVDGSQTVGYVPIDVQALGIHCLAAAGHKGLRALPGTGFLYVHSEHMQSVKPLMFGGTGISSERIDLQPDWPMSIEVGNLNLPGVISMAAAAAHLLADERRSWSTYWQPRHSQLVEGLHQLPEVKCIGATSQTPQIPVVSFLANGWDIHDLASVLDASFGIEARAGLHCAALIHAHIGTQASGGSVRFSLGHDCPAEHIDFALSCLREIMHNS